MRKNVNTAHIEGRIYQHDLEVKEVKNQASANFGKKYIGGTIEVATDEAGMNIVPVSFTYVTETTSNGGKNKTYAEMMKIITSGKTWMGNSPAEATMVSIDTSIALNDFVASDDSMVSQQIHQGGFVTVVPNLKDEAIRNTFKTDILITNVNRVEADPERHIDEDYVTVRGAIFNFKNDLLPVEYVVKNPAGMAYFEGLDASSAEPVYTQVWGRINFAAANVQVVTESAFGGAESSTVDVRARKVRQWVVTGASKVPYDFGDESVMTEDELIKAMQDRQVHLADVKKRREEYKQQKAAATPAASFGAAPTANVAPAAQGKFTF